MKRTFQPNNRRRHMKHGFRLRMRTRSGRAVINRRRAKGRKTLRLIIPISATGIVEVERLQSHRDFVTVLKRRRKAGGKDIVVHYLVPDDHHDDDDRTVHRRLGLAVSKSVGHAVTRNTVKRRFRVLARAHEDLLPAHCDIVLRAKPSAATASFASLDQQIAKAFATVAHKVAEA